MNRQLTTSTYIHPLTDFGFKRIFAQEENKELLISFLNEILEEELYCMKHLANMEIRPPEVQGKIFDKLFETAEIKQFTDKEMKTYNKSILPQLQIRPNRIMVGCFESSDGAVIGFHVFAVENMVDAEQKPIAIECDTHTRTAFHKRIR